MHLETITVARSGKRTYIQTQRGLVCVHFVRSFDDERSLSEVEWTEALARKLRNWSLYCEAKQKQTNCETKCLMWVQSIKLRSYGVKRIRVNRYFNPETRANWNSSIKQMMFQHHAAKRKGTENEWDKWVISVVRNGERRFAERSKDNSRIVDENAGSSELSMQTDWQVAYSRNSFT